MVFFIKSGLSAYRLHKNSPRWVSTSVNFDKLIYLCNNCHSEIQNTSISPPKSSFRPLLANLFLSNSGPGNHWSSFCSYSFLPFLECPIPGTIWYAALSLVSFTYQNVFSMHEVTPLGNSFHVIAEYMSSYSWTTRYLSIHQLMNIWVVSSWEQLWKRPL